MTNYKDTLYKKYDKTLKRLFINSSLMKEIGDFEIINQIEIEQFKPVSLEIDFAAKVIFKNISFDTLKILHIEFQTENDLEMPDRMFGYFYILRNNFGLPVVQYLIYLGQEEINMPNYLKLDNLNFTFNIIDLKKLSAEKFLKSNKIEDVILSLLCNLISVSKEEIVKEIINRINDLSESNIKKEEYFEFATILGELRNFNYIFKQEKKMIKFDIKDTFLYKDGFGEGIEKGIEKGKIEDAKKMINRGFSEQLILEITGLSIDEIMKIKQQ